MIVLDASALLAFLFREAGHDRVATVLSRSCLSTVNLSEVLGRFTRDGHDPQLVLQRLVETTIEIVPFTAADASATAALLPTTRHLGLSLGDRACLALARSRSAPALTADRVWAQLDIGIRIELIRE